MPLIDMPLAELRQYRGRNPRPADLDAYWAQALAEMRALDARVELVPSAFQTSYAECFDLYFTGVRGARIHAKFLRPRQRVGKGPAVLQFHGYSGNCGDWSDKLPYVAAGFCVAAMDARGQGGYSQDSGGTLGTTFHGHIVRGLDDAAENLLFRHIFLDTAQLAGIVMSMPEVDADRVGATGASQGGALTLACAALEPRVRRLAPVYPFLCDYRRVWEMDLAEGAYQELRDWFRVFDPLHEREEAVFTRLGYIDLQHLSDRIRGEVLMACALMDTICPPSTQFAMYNKIGAPKQLLIYPDYGHEPIPGLPDRIFAFLQDL